MSISPVRETRSPDLRESEPFLDPPDPDDDFEAQVAQSRQDRRHSYSSWTQPASTSLDPHPYVTENEGEHLVSNSTSQGWFSRVKRLFSSLGRSSKKGAIQTQGQPKRGRTTPLRLFWRTCALLLMFSGAVQVVVIVLGLMTAFVPEKLDYAFKTWRQQEQLPDQGRWPTDYTADIVPVACHSHNDYWRTVPLISAIKAGCTGVEADIWLVGEELYVGHKRSALTANRTLKSLYVNPLVQILDGQNPVTQFETSLNTPRNGVFDTDGSRSLILLIDFKSDYQTLWPVVDSQLRPLREKQYLTHFNGSSIVPGPITVVITGNAPFDYIVKNMTFRDMFFDAPLDGLASLADLVPSLVYSPSVELEYLASIANDTVNVATDRNQGQGHSGHMPSNPAIYTRANSYYASVDFQASIGWPRPYLSRNQRARITAQIAGARAQGLNVRYWGVPNWPIGLRNYLWRELVKMGVDYLNVDDLYSATKGDWRSGHSVWDWSVWGGRDW